MQSATTGGGLNNDAPGKILRIDPRANRADPYRIPAGNRFANDPAMIDEVHALGFRNPHNLTFAQSPDGGARLIVTDIGRSNFDKINLVVSGGNYGWSDREGPLVHLENGGILNGATRLPANDAGYGFIYPTAFVGHDGPTGGGFAGQSIAGGHVIANGSALDDQFIFGDFARSGRRFHVEFDDLLAARTNLAPAQTDQDLSWATPSEVTILFDLDNGQRSAPIVYSDIYAMLGKDRSDCASAEVRTANATSRPRATAESISSQIPWRRSRRSNPACSPNTSPHPAQGRSPGSTSTPHRSSPSVSPSSRSVSEAAHSLLADPPTTSARATPASCGWPRSEPTPST